MSKPKDPDPTAGHAAQPSTGDNPLPCCDLPPSAGGCFEIRVRGHLDRQWSDWLGGLEPTLLDNGEMVLSGTIVDQAALIGILNKLNGLNLTILSVRAVDRHG